QQLVGNRRTFARCGLDHLSTGMAPSVSKYQRLTAAALRPSQAAITAVAIDLQDAFKALEDLLAVDAAAPRRIVEHHAGRIGPAPRPFVAGQRPEIARLGAASSWVEHRCRRLVEEQLARLLEELRHARDDGGQVERGPADPVGQDRAIK